MGYGLLCDLWVWRRRTNRRPYCSSMSSLSTSSWTAWPDGSGRWGTGRGKMGHRPWRYWTQEARLLGPDYCEWQAKQCPGRAWTGNEHRNTFLLFLGVAPNVRFCCFLDKINNCNLRDLSEHFLSFCQNIASPTSVHGTKLQIIPTTDQQNSAILFITTDTFNFSSAPIF